MKYEILRTDTADAGLRRIILYVAQNFGNDIALEKLDEIENKFSEYTLRAIRYNTSCEKEETQYKSSHGQSIFTS